MRPKKYTEFIFTDVRDAKIRKLYGELGVAYKMILDLVEERNKVGITQAQLAKKVGITQPTLARFEAGRANLSLYRVIQIARALGRDVVIK